jgi:hypothetical protein
MSQKPLTPEQAGRAARRAEALRANLRRRKEASRREAPKPTSEREAPDD